MVSVAEGAGNENPRHWGPAGRRIERSPAPLYPTGLLKRQEERSICPRFRPATTAVSRADWDAVKMTVKMPVGRWPSELSPPVRASGSGRRPDDQIDMAAASRRIPQTLDQRDRPRRRHCHHWHGLGRRPPDRPRQSTSARSTAARPCKDKVIKTDGIPNLEQAGDRLRTRDSWVLRPHTDRDGEGPSVG